MEQGFGYLLAAFGVIWAVVFGYVLSLENRQKKLERELAQMKGAPGKK